MENTLSAFGVHAYWNSGSIVRGYDARRGVSFSAANGEWIAIVGDNGVGKSTLLHAIAGTVPFVTGGIWSNAVRLQPEDTASRFKQGILHVQQEPVFPLGNYWVKDAVTLATTWRPALRNDRVISDLISRLQAFELVQGERCSADVFDLIACIVAVPRVIMLDEVRARVTTADKRQFYKLLRPLIRKSIVLFIEHEIDVALSVADAVLWLRDDDTPIFGRVEQIADNVRKAAPIDEGPKFGESHPKGQALRTVRGDESILDQVELAVQCARKGRNQRADLLSAILSTWPFLSHRRPAETLSGGERITLAWLLLHTSGLGKQFPQTLVQHLSGKRRGEIGQMKTLIGE